MHRVGNRFGIRTVFKTNNTLRSILTKTKPVNMVQCSKNCIYSVPCECQKHYVGESLRPLEVRLNEHKNNIRRGETEKSKISEHVWEHGHHIQWKNAKILEKEPMTKKRKLKETAIILLNTDKCISNHSVEFNSTWLDILKDEIKLILQTFTILLVLQMVVCAPVGPDSNERRGKSLSFLDYLQPEIDYNNYDVDNDDYVSMALEENDLSRSIPARKQLNARPQPFNSPIYYIRLPPQPYMFVPGLGYISQPPPSPVSQFVNLPVSFVANGKPSSIYQWSGAFQGFQTEAPPPLPVSKPQRPVKQPFQDSTIHRIPGTFTFNGKPEDIYVLRDSYNSLYSDVLQNVYP